SSSLTPRTPRSTLFPYTTLFRSIVVSPDGRYALITTNGLTKPALTVVDIASWKVKSTLTIDAAWYGLAFSPDGTKIYSAGAAQKDRKSTRLNSSHVSISYAVFCL